MSYDPYGNDLKPSWLQRFGPKIGIGVGFGAVGFLLGRSFSVPGTTAFWDLAAQPAATVTAGVGAITAGYLAFHNGEKGRGLDAQHHRETMNGDRESNLQDRYTAAAKQLGDENSAIREAGAYAIAALADDWLRHGTLTKEAGTAHSQARACINLLCSYLRANRRSDFVGLFEREEDAVRSSIVGVLRERTNAWRKIEEAWIKEDDLAESSRIVIDLSGARLEDANFSQANLSGARLDGTYMVGADLRGANVQSAVLRKADLTKARLRKADFSDADLREANLTEAFAYDAVLKRVDADDATFESAKLRRAQFSGSSFLGTNFHQARLEGADFGLSMLGATNFCGANLGGVDFSEATGLKQSTLDDETVYTSKTKWEKCFVPQKGTLKPPRSRRPSPTTP